MKELHGEKLHDGFASPSSQTVKVKRRKGRERAGVPAESLLAIPGSLAGQEGWPSSWAGCCPASSHMSHLQVPRELESKSLFQVNAHSSLMHTQMGATAD